MDNEIYTIIWEKVRPETIELLKTGQARVINGVARDVSDNFKIVQHMPFEKIDVSDISNLSSAVKSLQHAQTIMLGMQVISSMAIIGAIVVATAYLSKKLDIIQEKIDMIKKELQDQNVVYYTEKISNFWGTTEATREIICNQDVVLENEDVVIIKLSELSTLRNQLFAFLNRLIFISDKFELEHKTLTIDFINMTIDLLPKAVFIESQAAYKIGRFHLGDNIRYSTKLKYYALIDNYKQWSNRQHQSIIKGDISSNTQAFANKYDDIKTLMFSTENQYLLDYST